VAILSFKIVYATAEDLELLVRHRILMWEDILDSRHQEATAQGTDQRTREWIREKLVSGKLIGLIAKTDNGKVAGSGCIWLRETPPLPFSEHVETPYLMSMYTEHGFRRKGVAKQIVEFAIEWCRKRHYHRINLDASEEGRKLYEKLGFEPGFSMRLQL
jgi:GNAT superfamily N-acetyltransferase